MALSVENEKDRLMSKEKSYVEADFKQLPEVDIEPLSHQCL